MLLYEEMLTDRLMTKPELSRQKPILIIEDDRSLRMIFDWLIKDLDEKITYDWCTSVDQAKASLSANSYELVFADFLLNGYGNGLDVWEYCNAVLPKAEFVMMSSLKLEGFCNVTGENGASPRLLAKPLDVNEIQGIIRRTLLAKEA